MDTLFPEADLIALWITLKLAFVSTTVLLLIGIPLAWLFTFSRLQKFYFLQLVFTLPIMLPPTVLGFYLLLLLSPESALGKLFQQVGLVAPAFHFSGLVIGSVLYSLPFVLQPIQNDFAKISREILDAAATLGAGKIDQFFSIGIPQAKNGILTAAVLGFAHTRGEFGVVLMVGGNIPEKTKVLSIVIFEHVENLEYSMAHKLSFLLLAISFSFLMVLYWISKAKVKSD
ncbi:MAG: molybdate ABC transporter permease subunit [Candidatus Hydrogenedentota bacterium]|nr:MAG: molybdate ABC transporter permease subunit [Candidatus Hydrogenedentota bacterium]